jgi:Ca2+-binding EF-hand superfamily protein
MSALRKLDLDGDGELEPDEIIQAYMEDGFSRDEAQQKIDELRGKYDIDGDGVVSLKEALNTELAMQWKKK